MPRIVRNASLVLFVLTTGVAAGVGSVAAAEPPLRPVDAVTMTLGGTGTAASAAAANDTLPAWCCYRYCYGGCYGGYTVGYYYPGFYTAFAGPVVTYYRPYFPVLRAAYRLFFGPRFGYYGFYYISGTGEDASAPVVSLAMSVANNPFLPRSAATAMTPTSLPAPDVRPVGTLRYDGGPTEPVPLPSPDATPGRATSASGAVPVSGPAPSPVPNAVPKSGRYMYKAYGER